jgi:hypothetical protein
LFFFFLSFSFCYEEIILNIANNKNISALEAYKEFEKVEEVVHHIHCTKRNRSSNEFEAFEELFVLHFFFVFIFHFSLFLFLAVVS